MSFLGVTLRVAQWFLGIFKVAIVRRKTLDELQQASSPSRDLRFLLRMAEDFDISWMSRVFSLSKSQLRQDLFVLAVLGVPKTGFFVEFGATNGVSLSNTFLLEKEFGWQGIVAEPARGWQSALAENRSCAVDYRCVWSQTGEQLPFNETRHGELSTLNDYSSLDVHASLRKRGQIYDVSTVSLLDLLSFHGAPAVIDYLSIDTEGSELEILRNFDFSQHRFRVITVEHNFTPARDAIFCLLQREGYRRVYEDLSHFDDWYVLGTK